MDYQDGSVRLYNHSFCSYRYSFYPADGSRNLVFGSGDSVITQGKRAQKSHGLIKFGGLYGDFKSTRIVQRTVLIYGEKGNLKKTDR